jgi:cytochrome c1
MHRSRLPTILVPLAALAAAVALAACGQEAGTLAYPDFGGDPRHGRQLIQDYGCGACHVVPGVAGATSTVGPPLTDFGRRQYIAGNLPNTPDNLIRWLQDPQAIEPGTAMPSLELTREEARDMAAYLLTLD